MNPNTLAAIVIVTGGVVLCFYIVYLGGKRAIEGSKNIAAGVNKTIEEGFKPIAKGGGALLDAIAGRIETRREELQGLRTQIASLIQENERLRNQQIKVDQIKPIFEVAFFQSDSSVRDFVKDSLVMEKEGFIERKEEIEYLGIFWARNTQKFGIDFEQLRFFFLSPTVVQVEGLGKTKLIGNLNTEVKPEHAELRRHLTGGKLPEAHEILTNDINNLLLNRNQKQQGDVYKAITSERHIDQIDQGVEMMTLRFLKDYFSPRGIDIIKATGELKNSKSLYEIQDEINDRVDKTIASNLHRLAEFEGKIESAEREIKEEITRLKDF